MKRKILIITAILLMSLFFFAVEPVSAAPDYDQTKYDPKDDVLRMRTGGDFKFSPHNNVEIVKMTSSYISGIIPQIELTMQVQGTIQNHDDYKYAFVVLADGDEYIFAAYQNDGAIGFKYESDQLILSASASGEGTDTLTITFNEVSIETPDNSFEFSGAAIYSVGDYERYADLAQPDKLILITEPSDGSTVSGSSLPIRGVIRDSIEGQPSGTVKIRIDSGDWEDVTGSNSWSYSLDTTSLSAGDHTISVKVDGSNLENVEDSITIKVDQNTANYDSSDEKPSVHVGDSYHYETMGTAKISGINLDISNEMDVDIEDFEAITVDGTDYETFRMHTTSEGTQDLGYISYSNDVKRTSWREKTDFSSVKDYTISIVTVDFRPQTTVETTTTYDPPLETHNFYDITVGFDNKWPFSGSSDSESETTKNDATTTNPPYSDSFVITGEVLYHLDSINIHGNTFEDIYVIRSYYENPGVSVIEFYSVELGVPVRIDTFDPSRELLFSLGLESWEQMPFSIVIGDVTFDPAQPEADTTNKIKVQLRNVGGEEAKNFEVTIKDGSQQVARETVTSVSEGATEDLTVDWTPSGEGNHSIEITVSVGSDDLTAKTVYVDVIPGSGDDGDGMFMILLFIVIIAVVAVVLVVVLMARKKKKESEIPAAVEGEGVAAVQPDAGAGVVVATEEVAAEPVQPSAAPAAVQQAPATTPQVFMENIQCPSCKNSFTVKFESKPIRVKCPTCGTEGVLN